MKEKPCSAEREGGRSGQHWESTSLTVVAAQLSATHLGWRPKSGADERDGAGCVIARGVSTCAMLRSIVLTSCTWWSVRFVLKVFISSECISTISISSPVDREAADCGRRAMCCFAWGFLYFAGGGKLGGRGRMGRGGNGTGRSVMAVAPLQ